MVSNSFRLNDPPDAFISSCRVKFRRDVPFLVSDSWEPVPQCLCRNGIALLTHQQQCILYHFRQKCKRRYMNYAPSAVDKPIWYTEYVLKRLEKAGNESTVCKKLLQYQHENVIRILNVYETDSRAEVLMSYVRGTSLQNFVQEQPGKRLYNQPLINLALMIAAGMNFLVRKLGVLHCDLDPRNIMITGGNVPIIIDFGHAVLIDDPHPPVTKRLPIFRAPETFASKQFTEKSDVFKYGIVLQYMCTGIFPFLGKSAQDISEAIQQDLIPRMPENHPLFSLVENCLQKDPSQRPTFEQIIHSLDQLGVQFNPNVQANHPSVLPSTPAMYTGLEPDGKTPLEFVSIVIKYVPRMAGLYYIDGPPEGYALDNIVCHRMPNFDEIDLKCPEKYQHLYQEKRVQTLQELERGEIFDRPMLALKEMHISRVYREGVEIPKITMFFSTTNYVHHRTMQAIFTTIATTPETRFDVLMEGFESTSKTIDYTTVRAPEFSTSFGINIGVFTTDRKVIITRRSSATKNPSSFNFSLSEGMNPDDTDKFGRLNIWVAARRALKEELGLNLSDDEMKAINISFVIASTIRHEFSVFGWIDLRNNILSKGHQLSLQGIKQLQGQDRFELSEIIGVDINKPEELLPYLKKM